MTRISATRRLYTLLQRAGTEQSRLGSDASAGQLLAAVVGVSKDDLTAQHDAYRSLLDLCDRSIQEITAYYWDKDLSKDDAQHQINHATQPVQAIRSNLLGNSATSKGRVLTQFDLGQLDVLALTVTRQSPERLLQKEDIEAARAALTSALGVITDSSLEPRFKAAFSTLISKAITALNQYDVFGPDSVADAIGTILAQSVSAKKQSAPDAGAALSKALGILGGVLTAVYRGVQLHQLLQGGPPTDDPTKYLPPGMP